MKVASTLYIFLLAAMFFAAQASYACNCTVPSIQQSYKKADVIFRGKVSYISYRPAAVNEAGRPAIVLFEVKKSWRGPMIEGRKFTLHTAISSESCQGMDFVKGEEYLVFADKDFTPMKTSPWTFSENKEHTYKTSRCLGTAKLAYSEYAIKQLDHLEEKVKENQQLVDVASAAKKVREAKKIVLKEEKPPVKTQLAINTEKLELLLKEVTEYGRYAAKGAQVAGYLAVSGNKDRSKVLNAQLVGVAPGTVDEKAIELAFKIGMAEAENDSQIETSDTK